MTGEWFRSLGDLTRHPRMRLFCFPYAGGGAHIFNEWPAYLGPEVEVIAAQLPGRGMRFGEPAFRRLDMLISELEAAILPFLDRPYALFGHSMGALIVFELARRLGGKAVRSPLHLFISGRSAPQQVLKDNLYHQLPDAAFINRLRDFDGTPAEILESPELLSLVLPVLRADFEMVETYVYKQGPSLDMPMTVFGGVEDKEALPEKLLPWQALLRNDSSFQLHMLPGGHFFIRDHAEKILNIIKSKIF